MVLVSVGSESGTIGQTNVQRNDLVAEVKARLLEECFPALKGKFVTLTHNGVVMDDENSIGDYGVHDLSAARFFLSVPLNQPYSSIDYSKLSQALIKEGRKKPAATYFHPGDAWEGRWTHGDEYLKYPPVDVNNRWSSVAPSTSRELAPSPHRGVPNMRNGAPRAMPSRPAPTSSTNAITEDSARNGDEIVANTSSAASTQSLYRHIPERVRRYHDQNDQKQRLPNSDQAARENLFRRARQHSASSDEATSTGGSQHPQHQTSQHTNGTTNRTSRPAHEERSHPDVGRSFMTKYTCHVAGCEYDLIHKAEGKWAGMAGFFTSNLEAHPAGTHACSSRVSFLPDRGCWLERQRLTGASGVSTHSTFYYVPQADKLMHVDTDLPELAMVAVISLREVDSHVLILTATHLESGQTLLTETITFSSDFSSRVRTGHRFDINGQLKGSYISRERKFVDEDSGAIEPYNFD
mmetsp:Transcript_11391/g.22294  ORF Transcript_11391/g.22294 Transcript_11391/m.22294 type:complete len:465 (+) Transcript_11391:159-1553(+)